MFYHFLAIMSDYHKGHRVCWKYSSHYPVDKELIEEFMGKMEQKCGKVQFAVHKLITDSKSLKSIQDKDSYFNDLVVVDDMDTFIDYVANRDKLSALDVAKFILTIWPTSHVKLQKILYYAYAEFLKKTGRNLFNEPIVSYKYGPVVEEVFREFTEHGSSIIDYEEDQNFRIFADDTAVTPSFLKVATSEYGSDAVQCILNTLEKYGEIKPFDLVDRTHRKNGPWDRVYIENHNNIIDNELILKYHHIVE